MPHAQLNRLADVLLRGGISPAHVRRYIAELQDHYEDLVASARDAGAPAERVAVHLLAFSAADGKLLDSSWTQGTPLTFVPGSGQLPPGLEKAVEGMKIGGRRQVDIPFADAFGEAGNTDLGLPASTDLIMVLDLVADPHQRWWSTTQLTCT